MSIKDNILDKEPVVVNGVIVVAIGAVVNLVVEFGVPVSEAQQTAIQGAVTAILALVYLIFTRKKVTPSAEVVVQNDGSGSVAADASPLQNGTPVVVDAAERL